MGGDQNFNYEDVSILVNQDKSRGFHKKIYSRKPELRRVVEMVKVKNGRILDAGCGGGLVTECLPEYYPKAKIYGCDISKTAINLANQYGTGKVSYKKMKKKFPYPSRYFDVCLCLDVLEHVPDVDFFLKEAKRVLKKDGVFFAAIPCEGQPFTLTWLFGRIGFLDNLTFKHVGHIHPEFTHDYVTLLLESNGFRILKKKYSERIPVQFLRYILFMLPKEILEFIIGKNKAENYYDKSLTTQGDGGKQDIIMHIRNLWIRLYSLTKFIDDIDAERFNRISLTAWKINLLAVKD